MTALQVKHTVDLGNVDNSFFEEHNVHLLDLRLLVVSIKLSKQVLSELSEVSNFLVVRGILVLKEIDEDSIGFSISHAVIFVFHLEVLTELLVKDSFELVLIFDRDQTIMEDTKDLVAPKFDDVFFGVLICLLSHVEALEDLTDISHVEDIVRLGRSG